MKHLTDSNCQNVVKLQQRRQSEETLEVSLACVTSVTKWNVHAQQKRPVDSSVIGGQLAICQRMLVSNGNRAECGKFPTSALRISNFALNVPKTMGFLAQILGEKQEDLSTIFRQPKISKKQLPRHFSLLIETMKQNRATNDINGVGDRQATSMQRETMTEYETAKTLRARERKRKTRKGHRWVGELALSGKHVIVSCAISCSQPICCCSHYILIHSTHITVLTYIYPGAAGWHCAP